MTPRAVNEGRQLQGVDEKITYTITTTPWGTSPSSVVVVAKDVTNANVVVTSTVFPSGAASVSGDVITLAPLLTLTSGHLYRIEVKFTSGVNIFETFFEVQAED